MFIQSLSFQRPGLHFSHGLNAIWAHCYQQDDGDVIVVVLHRLSHQCFKCQSSSLPLLLIPLSLFCFFSLSSAAMQAPTSQSTSSLRLLGGPSFDRQPKWETLKSRYELLHLIFLDLKEASRTKSGFNFTQKIWYKFIGSSCESSQSLLKPQIERRSYSISMHPLQI